jgi:retron-type reverse transcriptase
MMVERIVQKAASVTLFCILVRLDNLSGGWPIEGKLSDFALYIQSYPDRAARSADQPDMRIRVNSSKNNLDLHDRMQQYVDKVMNSEKGNGTDTNNG